MAELAPAETEEQEDNCDCGGVEAWQQRHEVLCPVDFLPLQFTQTELRRAEGGSEQEKSCTTVLRSEHRHCLVFSTGEFLFAS